MRAVAAKVAVTKPRGVDEKVGDPFEGFSVASVGKPLEVDPLRAGQLFAPARGELIGDAFVQSRINLGFRQPSGRANAHEPLVDASLDAVTRIRAEVLRLPQ